MSIALCLSGQPRFIKEGYKWFQNKLLHFQDMDVFIHTWKDSKSGLQGHITRSDNIGEIYSTYNVTCGLSESQRYDISPQGCTHEEFIHWSMFYSIYKANELKRNYEISNNFKYKCVIRSRFDYALLESLDVKDSNHNIGNVYTPYIHTHNGRIQDWINFSDSDTMDIYADAFNCMLEYKSEGLRLISGEDILSYHLHKNNINYIESSGRGCVIRSSGQNEEVDGTNKSAWINVDKL